MTWFKCFRLSGTTTAMMWNQMLRSTSAMRGPATREGVRWTMVTACPRVASQIRHDFRPGVQMPLIVRLKPGQKVDLVSRLAESSPTCQRVHNVQQRMLTWSQPLLAGHVEEVCLVARPLESLVLCERKERKCQPTIMMQNSCDLGRHEACAHRAHTAHKPGRSSCSCCLALPRMRRAPYSSQAGRA